MKAISAETMRSLDARAMKDFGIAGTVLMERAGTGIARCVEKISRLSGYRRPAAVLVAGKGNNGGDVFVAARRLHENGFTVEVLLACQRDAVAGDAAFHLKAMQQAGITPLDCPDDPGWAHARTAFGNRETVVVDGILGTGISGAPREPARTAIRLVNALAEHFPVVAVDIPSGLNADSGEAAGEVVRADVTATMALPKKGLLTPPALERVGAIEVIDIGLPDELITPLASDLELITGEDAGMALPRRNAVSHKGTYGHLLVIGGAVGYAGAVAMAVRAALHSGTGLVSVVTPEPVAHAVLTLCPEAMVHAGAPTAEGTLAADCLEKWPESLSGFDAVLIGPGLTTRPESKRVLEQVLDEARIPVLLDADALNLLAGRIESIRNAFSPLVLTPHPGELSRLISETTATIQANRIDAARRAAHRSGAVVVLKGAGSLVAKENRPLRINMTGNAGMATGGMGDVLSGIIAALLAQGVGALDAASAGVYIHGHAGDMAAWTTSQTSLLPTDVVDHLGTVFRELMGR